MALQQERADLPRFRRFGGAPAFIAGWGLYAASLGEELGLYRDVQAKFGALLVQLECATGVVVDTGVHAQNWSRAQALDYVHAQLPLGRGGGRESGRSRYRAAGRGAVLPGGVHETAGSAHPGAAVPRGALRRAGLSCRTVAQRRGAVGSASTAT